MNPIKYIIYDFRISWLFFRALSVVFTYSVLLTGVAHSICLQWIASDSSLNCLLVKLPGYSSCVWAFAQDCPGGSGCHKKCGLSFPLWRLFVFCGSLISNRLYYFCPNQRHKGNLVWWLWAAFSCFHVSC